MRIAGHPYAVMSQTELERIHAGALRILSEMGMEVQNRVLLERFAAHGFPVDQHAERVRFPSSLIENFIADSEKLDWEAATPAITASAGIYEGLYHDPESGQLVPWDEPKLAFYSVLARELPRVGTACMLGSRIRCPEGLDPLFERFYSWKYGALEFGSLHSERLNPYLLELYQLRAERLGKPVSEVFRGEINAVAALRLARSEAAHIAYFMEHGLRVVIGGGLGSLGATVPATLAGAVTLNLAEQLAINVLNRICFGDRHVKLAVSVSVLDMRTTMRPYGTPEAAIANVMTAQLARFYSASFFGHAGLTDAKQPSHESGAQKLLTAIPTLLSGGSLWMDAGLLATDEVCSPVQLVLDDECLGALDRLVREYQIDDETIAADTIFEAGPGGIYIDKPHTAKHFRAEHWRPGIWSREPLRPWLESKGRTDAERAREIVLQFQREAQQPAASELTEQDERRILALIKKAAETV